MAPRWSKTRQHEPKRRLTWPKRGQDGQVGAKMEPTWRGKVGPRWPSWSQDGPRERQDGAKMAKLEPRWSQHGSKMPKMCQHKPTLCQFSKSFIFLQFLKIFGPQDGLRESQGWAKRAKLEQRWPKRAPRSGQDDQVGAKMEPTWPQDAPTWPQRGVNMTQESAKI